MGWSRGGAVLSRSLSYGTRRRAANAQTRRRCRHAAGRRTRRRAWYRVGESRVQLLVPHVWPPIDGTAVFENSAESFSCLPKVRRPACALAQAGRRNAPSTDRGRFLRVSPRGSRCTRWICRTRVPRERLRPLIDVPTDLIRRARGADWRAPRRNAPGGTRLSHAGELANGDGGHRVRFKVRDEFAGNKKPRLRWTTRCTSCIEKVVFSPRGQSTTVKHRDATPRTPNIYAKVRGVKRRERKALRVSSRAFCALPWRRSISQHPALRT